MECENRRHRSSGQGLVGSEEDLCYNAFMRQMLTKKVIFLSVLSLLLIRHASAQPKPLDPPLQGESPFLCTRALSELSAKQVRGLIQHTLLSKTAQVDVVTDAEMRRHLFALHESVLESNGFPPSNNPRAYRFENALALESFIQTLLRSNSTLAQRTGAKLIINAPAIGLAGAIGWMGVTLIDYAVSEINFPSQEGLYASQAVLVATIAAWLKLGANNVLQWVKRARTPITLENGLTLDQLFTQSLQSGAGSPWRSALLEIQTRPFLKTAFTPVLRMIRSALTSNPESHPHLHLISRYNQELQEIEYFIIIS